MIGSTSAPISPIALAVNGIPVWRRSSQAIPNRVSGIPASTNGRMFGSEKTSPKNPKEKKENVTTTSSRTPR